MAPALATTHLKGGTRGCGYMEFRPRLARGAHEPPTDAVVVVSLQPPFLNGPPLCFRRGMKMLSTFRTLRRPGPHPRNRYPTSARPNSGRPSTVPEPGSGPVRNVRIAGPAGKAGRSVNGHGKAGAKLSTCRQAVDIKSLFQVAPGWRGTIPRAARAEGIASPSIDQLTLRRCPASQRKAAMAEAAPQHCRKIKALPAALSDKVPAARRKGMPYFRSVDHDSG